MFGLTLLSQSVTSVCQAAPYFVWGITLLTYAFYARGLVPSKIDGSVEAFETNRRDRKAEVLE